MTKFILITLILLSVNLLAKENKKAKEIDKKKISDIYINSMKKAEAYFDYGQYNKTITLLVPLLKNRYKLNKELVLKLYRKLALSYYNINDKENAEFYIKRIYTLKYEFQFDPVFVPPEFIEFAHNVFQNNQKELIENKIFLKEMIEKEDPDRYKIETKKFYKNFIPGAGQFQNNHYYKGGLILGSEVLFGLSSIITYGLLRYYQKKDLTFENTNLANLGKLTNNVSVIGFVVVYLYSTVDSLIYYNASQVEVIQYSRRFEIQPIITPKVTYVSFKWNF